MRIYFLEDISDNNVSGVILTNCTNEVEIQNCINEMKSRYPNDWTWDDLVNCLPSDCLVYSKYEKENKSIYY